MRLFIALDILTVLGLFFTISPGLVSFGIPVRDSLVYSGAIVVFSVFMTSANRHFQPIYWRLKWLLTPLKFYLNDNAPKGVMSWLRGNFDLFNFCNPFCLPSIVQQDFFLCSEEDYIKMKDKNEVVAQSPIYIDQDWDSIEKNGVKFYKAVSCTNGDIDLGHSLFNFCLSDDPRTEEPWSVDSFNDFKEHCDCTYPFNKDGITLFKYGYVNGRFCFFERDEVRIKFQVICKKMLFEVEVSGKTIFIKSFTNFDYNFVISNVHNLVASYKTSLVCSEGSLYTHCEGIDWIVEKIFEAPFLYVSTEKTIRRGYVHTAGVEVDITKSCHSLLMKYFNDEVCVNKLIYICKSYLPDCKSKDLIEIVLNKKSGSVHNWIKSSLKKRLLSDINVILISFNFKKIKFCEKKPYSKILTEIISPQGWEEKNFKLNYVVENESNFFEGEFEGIAGAFNEGGNEETLDSLSEVSPTDPLKVNKLVSSVEKVCEKIKESLALDKEANEMGAKKIGLYVLKEIVNPSHIMVNYERSLKKGVPTKKTNGIIKDMALYNKYKNLVSDFTETRNLKDLTVDTTDEEVFEMTTVIKRVNLDLGLRSSNRVRELTEKELLLKGSSLAIMEEAKKASKSISDKLNSVVTAISKKASNGGSPEEPPRLDLIKKENYFPFPLIRFQKSPKLSKSVRKKGNIEIMSLKFWRSILNCSNKVSLIKKAVFLNKKDIFFSVNKKPPGSDSIKEVHKVCRKDLKDIRNYISASKSFGDKIDKKKGKKKLMDGRSEIEDKIFAQNYECQGGKGSFCQRIKKVFSEKDEPIAFCKGYNDRMNEINSFKSEIQDPTNRESVNAVKRYIILTMFSQIIRFNIGYCSEFDVVIKEMEKIKEGKVIIK